MDFDEYDYLEKAVEFTGAPKEKVEHRSSRHDHRDRRDDRDEKGESRRALKKPKDEEQNGERRDRREDRERTPLRREKDHHHRDREDKRDKERRSGDENRDRDKEKERRSRDENRDREREEKERKRERERRSSSRSRRHDREAEIETEREGPRRSSSMPGRHAREAEMDMERERSRRSSSRSARQDREVELERERARSLDRAVREREAERELRERESRRLKDKKEVEPEADPERDQRTVFAYQMPLKATERDVYEFFTRAGKVRDVRLIMDRNSRRSKGVGYIEFYDVGSVQAALQLSGQLLLGQPVMVKHSEAEKNLVQSTAAGGSALAPGSERKLYVGNLHFNMNEEQLRQIFEAFGPVELVQLPLDMETGQCKGFGFVQFAQIEHAKAAQQSLNGTLEIAGRIVKVSSVTEHVGVQDTGTNVTDFDDDDGGGLALNARSRAILMQKLDRTGTATSIVGSLGVPVLNGSVPTTLGAPAVMTTVPSTFPTVLKTTVVEPIGDPSECILLKNMFDPSTETDPDFDLDIKEDVQDECSKFGMVKHIYVDKNSNGHVYLRFDSVAAAANCQRAMHMRWFARRCISATYMRLHEYEAKMRSVGAA